MRLSNHARLGLHTQHRFVASTNSTCYVCGVTGTLVGVGCEESHVGSAAFRRNKLIFERLQGGTSDQLDCAADKSSSNFSKALDGDTRITPGAPSPTLTGKLTPAAAFWKQAGNKSAAGISSALRLDEGVTASELVAAHRRKPPPLSPRHIWEAVSKNVLLLAEFNLPRHSQRLSRVNTALKFLRDHHVILHSPLRWSGGNEPTASGENSSTVSEVGNAINTWNVSSPFYRVAMVGEVQLRSEVTARMTKLFPLDAILSGKESTASESLGSAATLSELISESYGEDNLAKLFDSLEMGRILERQGRRQLPLTNKQKASMLCAVVGELHWFAVRTKATDRSKVTALFPPSDVLILHVLAIHTLEVITASLVYQMVEPTAMNLLRYAWPFFTSTFVEQVADKTPVLSKVMRLAESPRSFDPLTDTLVNLLPREPSEIIRRVSILVEAEKGAIDLNLRHSLDVLDKGISRVQSKLENLRTLSALPGSGADGRPADVDMLKKRRLQPAPSDWKAREESYKKKLDALSNTAAQLQERCSKQKAAVDAKYTDMVVALKAAAGGKMSPVTSVNNPVLVSPLLHHHRFLPGTTIRREVSHSEVALNYHPLVAKCSLHDTGAICPAYVSSAPSKRVEDVKGPAFMGLSKFVAQMQV